jgi:iron(III) transport system substrate-binding protein
MPARNTHKKIRQSLIGGLVLFICIFGLELSVAASELNIYSHRQPFLINPFIDAYQAKTGVKVNVVYASKGLAQRLQSEGERSPADVILTVDMARLNVYVDKGLLASIQSDALLKNVPSHLRDPNNRWFSFSKRARVIVLSLKSKDTGVIKNYEDLVDPKWKGRICVRPGSHVYNRALVASLINVGGTEFAENWASGLIKNLARRPQGNDRAQVKAIYEGICDIAIINNYYFGKLKYSNKEEQRKWAAAVRLVFPNQKGRGAHINISGGGVAKYSKNKKEAIRFLEFLTSKEAQNLYGSVNFEYPVNPSVEVPEELQSWGNFKEDQMPISQIAKLAPEAQKIIDRVGW